MQRETKWFWLVFIMGVGVFLWVAFEPFREAVIRMYRAVLQLL